MQETRNRAKLLIWVKKLGLNISKLTDEELRIFIKTLSAVPPTLLTLILAVIFSMRNLRDTLDSPSWSSSFRSVAATCRYVYRVIFIIPNNAEIKSFSYLSKFEVIVAFYSKRDKASFFTIEKYPIVS